MRFNILKYKYLLNVNRKKNSVLSFSVISKILIYLNLNPKPWIPLELGTDFYGKFTSFYVTNLYYTSNTIQLN